MTNLYAVLGLEKNASINEITKAYRHLAKTCHPDKVQGKEAQFILIQEAYDTLSDSDKRRVYDGVTEEFSFSRFKKEKLRFCLPQDPMQYDHYQYINILFDLQGDERLTTGQSIVDVKALDQKLLYVNRSISPAESYWSSRFYKLNAEDEAKKNKYVLNLKKLRICSYVLCESSDKKKLYDFSIGVDQSEEMKQIGVSIGGVARLKQYIKKKPNLFGASELFVLRKAHLLTPDNFSHLLSRKEYPSDNTLSENLTMLLDHDLLTQDNFNLLMKYNKYEVCIYRGFSILQYHQLFNKKYVDVLLGSAKNAAKIAYTLEELHLLGILNEENLQTVVHKIPDTEVWRALSHMKSDRDITKAHSIALHWSGPEEIKDLNEQLDKMLAHGLFLLSCNSNQGIRAMVLALDLKQSLKEFFEKTPQQQHREKEQFKRSFNATLHSEDKSMTVHRELWKVIIANVAIAFTGIGLLAIGLNLAINGRCFFAKTKREQFIDTIEHLMPRPH